MFFQVVPVPFHPYARGMVSQQGYLGMDQEGASFLANGLQDLLQGLVAGGEVIAFFDGADLQSVEAFGEFRGILGPRFFRIGRDIPFIVLHKVKDGHLLENGHLEGFGDLSFGDGSIAQRAYDHRLVLAMVFGQSLVLHVLYAHGNACGRDRLHAGGRGLVGDLGFVLIPEAGVAVVGSSTTKRVVLFGQKLEHEFIGLHANAQEYGVVPVIGSYIVLRLELQPEGQLDGFMAPGGGMDILAGDLFVLLVDLGHPFGLTDQLPRFS